LQCEVCGRPILGKPYKAMIEGAKMVVCAGCAKLGTAYWEAPPPPPTTPRRWEKRTVLPPRVSARRRPPELAQALELVEDFGPRVRGARRGLGLSQEDLGKRIGEKVSVLRKVEGGKMRPDERLAAKLEHALRIKLLVPPSEPQLPPAAVPRPSRVTTLGDIVQVREKKRGEVDEERGPS